jgi:hypothetical protein
MIDVPGGMMYLRRRYPWIPALHQGLTIQGGVTPMTAGRLPANHRVPLSFSRPRAPVHGAKNSTLIVHLIGKCCNHDDRASP